MTFDWSIVLDVGVGLGVLLIGAGVLFACIRLASLLHRLLATLDEVDRQLGSLGPPLAHTLAHVGEIADTADVTLGRLGGIAGNLESITGQLVKTSSIAQEALAPSLINIGATLSGVTAAVRRLTQGKSGGSKDGGRNSER